MSESRCVCRGEGTARPSSPIRRYAHPVLFAPFQLHASCCALVLAVLFAPGIAPAQDIQIPFDDAGRVEVLTRRLAGRLEVLLEEFPGLVEARLYRTPGDSYLLEIISRPAGQSLRETRSLTPEEADRLRRLVMDRMEAFGGPGAPVEARTHLVVSSTLLGTGFYGWAVPVVFDVSSARARVGLYMLTAGASFFAPWLATSRSPVTYGESTMAFSGATRGIVYGALLREALAPRVDDGDGRLATIAGASIAGGIGGFYWAHRSGMTAGNAHMVANGSDFGMLAAAGVLILADAEDEQAVAGIALVGGALGSAAAYRLARTRPYSWGDAEVLRTFGLLGGYSAAVVANWSSTRDENVYAGAVLAGSAAGLALGERFVRRTEFTTAQAILIDLATLAGGLTGLGIGYLLAPDDPDAAWYLTPSAAGAAAGFAATSRAFARDARRAAGHGAFMDRRVPSSSQDSRERRATIDPRMQSRPFELRLHPTGIPAPRSAHHNPIAKVPVAAGISVSIRF